jgi:hypothetical protein
MKVGHRAMLQILCHVWLPNPPLSSAITDVPICDYSAFEGACLKSAAAPAVAVGLEHALGAPTVVALADG